MINRPLYLDKITPFIDRDLIKILVGIRRAGKSTILSEVADTIKRNGVAEQSIAQINFDSLDYSDIRDKQSFLALVKSLHASGIKYYFFDEVQLVNGWDEVVSALYAEKNADIYISGSNSKLLSSELSTFLTGRYVNTRVHTLNFSEFLDFAGTRGVSYESTTAAFDDYLHRGGFPIVNVADTSYAESDQVISDIYSSIVLRDIVQRKSIRNTELLSRIVKFVFDNIGNVFSANSITNFLKNEKRDLAPETIYNYLDYLAEAFVISRVPRYDLRGKAHLKTQEKYYLGDIGLLYAVNGRSNFQSYLPGLLENVVYHELVSHGFEVFIGKNGDQEIDFIAKKPDRTLYLQVATHLDGAQTIAREFDAFDGLPDDTAERYVLSLDHATLPAKHRATHQYLPDFILTNLS